ncbi:DNA-3-methyladenine glycosylase I [Pontiella sp.]|uniref:DNA-3-methyladenine glycosylase I n=1 Tax=Pontiella sp. TaxID=2837462 RepID=UPI003568BBCC
MKTRCAWLTTDPLYLEYHDEEWGVPEHDDRKLYEKIVLEGAQAGLSWITILKRRENYRRAFDHFEIEKVAAYTEQDVERLVKDAGIIRNRSKIKSAINNARRVLEVREQHGSLDAFLWSFVGGRPIFNRWESMKQVPATTPESDAMAKALKKAGFTFVGSTTCYALMQAMGMVNDHTIDCFRHAELNGAEE